MAQAAVESVEAAMVEVAMEMEATAPAMAAAQ